jgi:NADH:ubiquinone oxidoreductase subunit F (NADH-binding)
VGTWKAVSLGGFSGGVAGASSADLRIDPSTLAARELMLGCASFRILREDECMGAFAAEVLAFFARESCGQCFPCAQGLNDALSAVEGKPTEVVRDVSEAVSVLADFRGRGVCKLPDGASCTLSAIWHLFPKELNSHAAGHCQCPSVRK